MCTCAYSGAQALICSDLLQVHLRDRLGGLNIEVTENWFVEEVVSAQQYIDLSTIFMHMQV